MSARKLEIPGPMMIFMLLIGIFFPVLLFILPLLIYFSSVVFFRNPPPSFALPSQNSRVFSRSRSPPFIISP